MNKETQLWYLKSKGRTTGPFASGLISKNILLGRIHLDDLLSQDKNTWRKASSIAEVIPEVIKHRHQANYKERLKAARRWADERQEIREVDVSGNARVYTPRKKITHLKIKTTGIGGIIALIVVISSLLLLIFFLTPEEPLVNIDCSAAAQDGNIYDGCHLQRHDFSNSSLKHSSFKNTLLKSSRFNQSQLQGSNMDFANLSHADLSATDLSDASLRAVDLSGALLKRTNFTNADLSYADLTNAKAIKLKLAGAILANTIWFDGSVCDKKSIGQCLRRE